MSDLTPYNRDVLEDIRRRARKEKMSVTVRRHDVFIHPKEVKIPFDKGNPDNPNDPYGQYWKMWAMEW